ncbi:MAG TPA: ATP-grasp domain-containing protein [Bacteroidota bacterium]|nr:ATP-grasp domain-containing protein [Bacteroidota bacterium]
MEVALVYNMKKEESDVSEDGGDPSSQHITDVSTHIREKAISADTYAEWDTAETVFAVRDALALRHSVTMIEADEDAFGKLRALTPDIVFNIAEGKNGVSREAQIPAMLEMLEIPYTGSDALTLALCLDKSRTKEILSYHKIPTARFSVVHSLAELSTLQAVFPSMVKPLNEGSSKGIFNTSLVHTQNELHDQVGRVLSAYEQPVIVEEFLPGREFTVALIGNGSGVEVLPIVEILFDSLPAGVNPIYSYEAKWIWDQASSPLEIFECPAKVSPELHHSIAEVCRKTYGVLRCRDWSRIDVRMDQHGIPNIIEVNPLPGILPKVEDNSCFPKAARAAGMSYDAMLNRVLDEACKRYRLVA